MYALSGKTISSCIENTMKKLHFTASFVGSIVWASVVSRRPEDLTWLSLFSWNFFRLSSFAWNVLRLWLSWHTILLLWNEFAAKPQLHNFTHDSCDLKLLDFTEERWRESKHLYQFWGYWQIFKSGGRLIYCASSLCLDFLFFWFFQIFGPLWLICFTILIFPFTLVFPSDFPGSLQPAFD